MLPDGLKERTRERVPLDWATTALLPVPRCIRPLRPVPTFHHGLAREPRTAPPLPGRPQQGRGSAFSGARNLCAPPGRITDRTFENQSYRASGLNLVIAAIVYWNTVYMERAVGHLRSTGVAVPDHLLGVTTRKCPECTTSGTNEERHTAVPSELQPTCAAVRLRNDRHFQQRRSSRFKWDSRVRCRGGMLPAGLSRLVTISAIMPASSAARFRPHSCYLLLIWPVLDAGTARCKMPGEG